MAIDKQPSPSQRLRFAIYREWEVRDEVYKNTSSERYYEMRMSQILKSVLDILESKGADYVDQPKGL